MNPLGKHHLMEQSRFQREHHQTLHHKVLTIQNRIPYDLPLRTYRNIETPLDTRAVCHLLTSQQRNDGGIQD